MEAHGVRKDLVNWVILDTNMLLVPYQFGVDIISEIRRIMPEKKIGVLRGTLKELEGIGEKKGVKLAKMIVEKHVDRVFDHEGKVDDALVEMAERGAVIATNDKELKKRVLEAGGKIVYLRKKRILEVMGEE